MRSVRRSCVRLSPGVGAAAAVLPVQAGTMISTDTHGLTAGEVKIPTTDGEGSIPAYRAQPAGRSGLATVLVVQEIFGVHEYIRDVCRRLAKLGYLAVAPELYARQGDVSKMEIPEILANVVSKVPDVQVMADLDAAAAWAARNGGGGKLGITGFCWGGRIVWIYAAHDPSLAAGVAWYGGVATGRFPGDKGAVEVAGLIKAPVLGLYGGADAGIPTDTVDTMRAALKSAGNTRSEIIVYPDTPHAFHADYRPSYRKEQAEDGWKRLTAWFRQYLV
ncbi:MAG TPA: dienelactone hydrolase family protein [Burkholderiaceae bacterium]|nr:dienelactone hydrolase family protein [Burkholderiaceae bacterium]